MAAGVLAALAVLVWVTAYRTTGGQHLDWKLVLPAAVMLIMAFTVAAPGVRHVKRRPVADGRVVAVIPAFNEDPDALYATIRSLLEGTRPPDEIHVVDDGSDEPIPPFEGDPRVFWYRKANGGKRKAQALVLRRITDIDFFLTVDSDCTVDRHAIQRLLQAMSREGVQAATGLPLTRNRRGWLTRVIDLEIASICLTYRAARSMLGSLNTCSGALSLYRAGVVLDNLDDYTSGKIPNGDDRRLTHYSMQRGRVASVPEAIVHTDMPTSIRKLYRQRLRWSTSHWHYALWEIANLPTAPMLWSAYHLMLSIIVPAALAWTLIAAPLLWHGVEWQLLAYWTLICWLLNIKYAVGRPQMRAVERWLTWLLGTPLVVAVHLFVLRPAMIHALFRLRTGSWGTRGAATTRGRYRTPDAAAGRYRLQTA